MRYIEKGLGRLSSAMRLVGGLCVLGMAFVTVADICGRVNRSPIFGSEEIAAFLAVLAVGLSLPYAHAHRSHIGVEVLVQRLSLRARRVLKVFRDVLSIGFFLVLTWMMGVYALDKGGSGEVSMNLGLPEYLFVGALTACLAVTTLTMLVDLFRFLIEWRRA